jgi:hypothetical protein
MTVRISRREAIGWLGIGAGAGLVTALRGDLALGAQAPTPTWTATSRR